MGLTILFGDGTKDRELALLEKIKKTRQSKKDGQFFYLVPNKIKFKTEINVLKRLAQLDHRSGSALVTPKVQVFSLSRLAWYYMNETKLYQRANLSPEALVMLIQSLLNEHQTELKLYGNLLNKQGFISQMASQIQEIKQAGLTWDEVQAMADNLDDEPVLQNKLLDLVLIGTNLDDELGQRNQFLNSDLLGVLKQYLLRGEVDLSSQYFYIDGYSQMTPSEVGVVEALIAMSAEVTIALPGENGSASHLNHNLDENELFFAPKRLAQQLQAAAQSYLQTVVIQAIDQERPVKSGLKGISDFWIEYEHNGIPAPTKNDDIELWGATSKYQEIEQIAQKLHNEIINEKARYRDFVLMTPDLGQYQNIIPAIFAKYNLPLYLDNDQMMTNHPLIAFVKQLLNLSPQYSLNSILNLLKTELLIPKDTDIKAYREALAITENFALSKNYFGQRWIDPKVWKYDYQIDENSEESLRQRASENDAQLALIHDQISQKIAPFLTQLSQSPNVRQMVQQLYQFLKDQGVDQRILVWRDQAVANGDMAAAQQMEQVWNQLMAILDDTVTVFDQQSLTISELNEALMAAFSNAKYSGIPAAMDQVLVTETGMVQLVGVPNVIIFGATNINLPATVHQKSLLQDLDRKKLQKQLPDGKKLRDTTDILMAQDSLNLYQAMMIGERKIIWSFPTSDGNSKLKPSTYVERLQRAFQLPIQQISYLTDEQKDLIELDQLTGTIASARAQFILAAGIAQQNQQPLAAGWQLVKNALDEVQQNYPDTSDIQKYKKLLTSLNYRNQSEQIEKTLVQALFGTELKTSISRLETYAKNPYEFLLHYGLKLQPRSEMELTAGEQGSLMHAILEKVFIQLKKEPLGALSNEALEQLETQTLKSILAADDPTFEIFTTSKRFEFITRNLAERVHYALVNMQRGQRESAGIITQGTETTFGQGLLKPLQFKMGENVVTVRGKVDRYDMVHNSQRDQNYLAIIDYKSKQRKFNYTEAFNGLELQLLTYWEAMNLNQTNGMKVQAANFMELQREIHEPFVQTGQETYQFQQQTAVQESKQELKYQGLIEDDEGFIEQLEMNDDTPYRIERKADGKFKANSDVVTSEKLETLLKYNKAQIKTLAGKILAGKFPIAPYRQGTHNGLQYTDYRDVIQFDAMLNNKYRDLKSLKAPEALKQMQAKLLEQEGK
ncbi:ATP-dependent helicase/deoxyribonuclease subunit B [Weissella koreensis KACC 15510]|uniref:PD-(D/E)XK nuclease family protein n=1 Tax=Weissella koreensis TaxID=165096 RepID=UPI00021751E7|nr:PD-(D/E)XK nuclease family protein [Weissella koreensis]AEJ23385.1 ATP-dependent helicase/deoxyribonuclease subunit B [Weissella koreensis KACC 15510]